MLCAGRATIQYFNPFRTKLPVARPAVSMCKRVVQCVVLAMNQEKSVVGWREWCISAPYLNIFMATSCADRALELSFNEKKMVKFKT